MWSSRASIRDEAQALADQLGRTRRLTLWLASLCTEEELQRAYHPDFSPIAWHLGHVGAFEDLWVAVRGCALPALNARHLETFDPRMLPKPERRALPSGEALLRYLQAVRGRTMELLGRCISRPQGGLCEGLYAFRFVLAHEQQHAETIATVLRMRPESSRSRAGGPLPEDAPVPPRAEPLTFARTEVWLGTDDPRAGYDNEAGRHRLVLQPFSLDARPATNADWRAFIDEGGYRRRELWSLDGWRWLESAKVERPSTWSENGLLQAFSGDVPLPLAHPVEGVSWFEAEAFARWKGGRLPTEAEWELAAREGGGEAHVGLSCGATRAVGAGTDFVGNVWEWTASAFAPYPGFQAFPYDGYSQPYFDGRHRVLRGGSWASQHLIARTGFRNWYEPHWRQVFAGVRVAWDR